MARERLVLAFTAFDPRDRARLAAIARGRGYPHVARRPGEPRGEGARESLVFDGREITVPGRPPRRIKVATVTGPSDLETALNPSATASDVAIRWVGDRVIPLETAVARRSGRFRLWVVTERARDVPAALGALEHGAERVIVEIASGSELDALEEVIDAVIPVSLLWETRKVSRVEPAGMGDRILVDTTSILREGEGMLVGSAAAFLFHLRGETLGSRYTRPRPFRVNAGPPHSYTLMPDGSTRYLSELDSGERILVAAPRLPPRIVRIGRVKVERRPLLRVECADSKVARTVFVQEAETVRLTSGRGGGRPATDLSANELLLGVRLPSARHLGHAVSESIDER